MKRLASIVSAACLACFVAAQGPAPSQGVQIIKMRVMHADPWAVKALIEGSAITQPELSTILGFAGIPDRESELLSSFFGGRGTLVVNPTDNSLIFIPRR